MNDKAVAAVPARGVIADMAARYGMDKEAFERTLRATVIPVDTSKEQFAAFLLVAKEYGLNPVVKQIYAFPAKGGGIQPIVSIDGWIHMTINHPQFDGMEFGDNLEDGKLSSITCRMYRKDRSRPVEVTEYMSECKRDTDTWKRWPARMLRHRATIQCARYAFGFAGIVDPEEFDRMKDVTADATVVERAPLKTQVRRLSEPAEPAQQEEQTEIIEQSAESNPPDALTDLLQLVMDATTDEELDYIRSRAKETLKGAGLKAVNDAIANKVAALKEQQA